MVRVRFWSESGPSCMDSYRARPDRACRGEGIREHRAESSGRISRLGEDPLDEVVDAGGICWAPLL